MMEFKGHLNMCLNKMQPVYITNIYSQPLSNAPQVNMCLSHFQLLETGVLFFAQCQICCGTDLYEWCSSLDLDAYEGQLFVLTFNVFVYQENNK